VTDARFPERWLNDRRISRLSDPAFRLHVTALVWSVGNRTDGVIDDSDLTLIPRVDTARVAELDKAGLWRRERDYWVIVDFDGSQTTSNELAMLDNLRRRERDKKARQRARPKPSEDVPGDSPGDGPQGLHRTGQDRTDQARTGTEENELDGREQEDWPEVREPGHLFGEGSWLDGPRRP